MFSTDKLSAVVGNTAVKDLYIGYYNWTDGTIRENLNTNVIADVYIPKIGFTVSATIELNRTLLRKRSTKTAHLLPIWI